MASSARLAARLGLAVVLIAGCAPAAKDAPLRSPSRDFPGPPVTTSDGRVVGADNKPPADWMGEHASSAGLAPGWNATEKGLSHDPARRVGGALSEPPSPTAQPREGCKRDDGADKGGYPRLRRESLGCVPAAR